MSDKQIHDKSADHSKAAKPAITDEMYKAVNIETARVLHDTTEKMYFEEVDRGKSVDNKTSIYLGATSAGLLFLLGSASKFPDYINNSAWLLGIYTLIIFASLGFLVTALFYFIRAIRVAKYERIEISNIVDITNFEMIPQRMFYKLALTYRTLIKNHTDVTDKKIDLQETGLILLSIGIAVLGIGVIIAVVVLSSHDLVSPVGNPTIPTVIPTIHAP